MTLNASTLNCNARDSSLNLEGFRVRQATVAQSTVPTVAVKTGNFSGGGAIGSDLNARTCRIADAGNIFRLRAKTADSLAPPPMAQALRPCVLARGFGAPDAIASRQDPPPPAGRRGVPTPRYSASNGIRGTNSMFRMGEGRIRSGDRTAAGRGRGRRRAPRAADSIMAEFFVTFCDIRVHCGVVALDGSY